MTEVKLTDEERDRRLSELMSEVGRTAFAFDLEYDRWMQNPWWKRHLYGWPERLQERCDMVETAHRKYAETANTYAGCKIVPLSYW